MGFLFFHFKNVKRAWGGGGELPVNFQRRRWVGGGGWGKRTSSDGGGGGGGGGGGEKRSPTGGGEEIADGGRDRWGGVGMVDGNGDGEAPTCSKWVGFPRLFFPSWLRLLYFPQILKSFPFFGDL